MKSNGNVNKKDKLSRPERSRPWKTFAFALAISTRRSWQVDCILFGKPSTAKAGIWFRSAMKENL